MNVIISLLENIARVTQKITWFVTFLLAGTMAVRGNISVGTLVMFISLFGELNSSVTLYAQTLPILLSIRPDIKKMLKIIDNKENEFCGNTGFVFQDQINIENLSFRYTEGIPVLDKLNLSISKNEKVVLIGASGCGKSTLIKLLSGNYSDYTGSICYDNIELHKLDLLSLQRQLVVIHQNTFIFNNSIRFNICLDEEFSEEILEKALQASGVNRFLSMVPGGLDGQCGENGSKLSGGQKQRIALARALIRGANILILDEGVSAIDVETANEIEQELLNMKDLTLVTITHRIKDGLTEQYDRVLVMENGKLRSETYAVRR